MLALHKSAGKLDAQHTNVQHVSSNTICFYAKVLKAAQSDKVSTLLCEKYFSTSFVQL